MKSYSVMDRVLFLGLIVPALFLSIGAAWGFLALMVFQVFSLSLGWS